MFGRLILIVAAGVGIYLLLRWFARTPPKQLAGGLRKGLLYGGIVLLVLLALTGRLHWLFAAAGAAIPLLQRAFMLFRALPMVQQILRMAGISIPGIAGASSSGNRVSTIRTRFLNVSLDHASGEMDGEITDGPHQGQRLSALPLEEVIELLNHYQAADGQSAAVLEAYLDRQRDAGWRNGTTHQDSDHGAAAGSGGRIGREEALAILGLQEGADRKAIRDAHRRLMQKLHPDRGGSDWLAARINQAKDTLLED